MKKFRTMCFVLGCLLMASMAMAKQQSVIDGRADLFKNDGNPSYNDIVNANQHFKDAVAADPADQEAHVFYAVTRLMVFGLENGSGAGYETLRDLLEAFGIPINLDSVANLGSINDGDSPFADPPEINGYYNPPPTIPSGEDVRALLAVDFVKRLDEVLGYLDGVNGDFSTILYAGETGELTNIEVDYGDVLVYKSTLLTVKAFILFMTAYDLNFDTREIVALNNAGIFQIQRDLLEKYNNFLKLRGSEGAASLTSAKYALLEAIDTAQAAFNFITTEPDYPAGQDDDLFAFDSNGDVEEARFFLTHFTEMENSLRNNTPATITEIDETWLVTDIASGNQLRLYRHKDNQEHTNDADAWGVNGCDFISCYSDVTEFSVNGTAVTIVLEYGGSCWGSATFTGTITGGKQISGTYDQDDNCRKTVGNSFTAMLDEEATETSKTSFDLNRVFGNTGKAQLDIRDVLPNPMFNRFNEFIPGTFKGDPPLNGIPLDSTSLQPWTNEKLVQELGFVPSDSFQIPTVADNQIAINGDLAEWPPAAFVFRDKLDDEKRSFRGTDLNQVYLAKDSNYLYTGLTFYNENYKDPLVFTDGHHTYAFSANTFREMTCSTMADFLAFVLYDNVNLNDWQIYSGICSMNFTPVPDSEVSSSVSKASVEWKIPLDVMGNLPGKNILSGKYISMMSAYSDQSYFFDENLTTIQLDTVTITGNITLGAHNGSGNIYVLAYDGKDKSTAKMIGGTYLPAASLPGSYTLTDMAVGAEVYLYAWWDVDGNGVQTDADVGDFFPSTPVQVVEGGLTEQNLIDKDGDTVVDVLDLNPSNPDVCIDSDLDTCDDCASGIYDPANDGSDADGDGICDAGDDCLGNNASGDNDSDGICNDRDNCPNWPNPLQTDNNGDEIGDDCNDARKAPTKPTAAYWEEAGLESVKLLASAYKDPDGDALTISHWRVWRRDLRNYLINDEVDETSLTVAAVTTDGMIEHVVHGLDLSPGLKYVWQVRYEDSTGQSSDWSEPSDILTGKPVNNANPRVDEGSVLEKYSMISFFVWAIDQSCEEVVGDDMVAGGGGYDTDYYRFGTYDPISRGYLTYDQGLEIEPGRAYWVLAREGLSIDIDGVPVSLTHDIEVPLKYNSDTKDGWNQIAPPNNSNYSWKDVQIVVYDQNGNVVDGPIAIGALPENNPYIDKRIWWWVNGRYSSGTDKTMERNSGYWVKVKQPNVSLRFPAVSAVPAAMQSNFRTMFAMKVKRLFLRVKEYFSFPAAVADSGDSPPMPMGDFSVSPTTNNGGGGGGCFITTTATENPWSLKSAHQQWQAISRYFADCIDQIEKFISHVRK